MTDEQAIELAFIEAFPGDSEAQKKLYRYELEAWLSQALERISRTIAAGPKYRLTQKTYAIDLGKRDSELTFLLDQTWSAERGWGTGVEQEDGVLTGVIRSFATSNESLAPVGAVAYINSNYVQFTWNSALPVAIAFYPKNTVPTLNPEDPNALLACAIETPGNLAVWAAGVSKVNPDTAGGWVEGHTMRVVFAANGAVTVQQRIGPDIIYAEYAVPDVTITQECVVVLQFLENDASLKNVIVGVANAFMAKLPSDKGLIIDSLLQRGSVKFEGGRALGYVSDFAGLQLPRVNGQWYWSLEGEAIRVAIGTADTSLPPSRRLQVTLNTIPRTEDLQREFHDDLISALVSIARERAGADAMREKMKRIPPKIANTDVGVAAEQPTS